MQGDSYHHRLTCVYTCDGAGHYDKAMQRLINHVTAGISDAQYNCHTNVPTVSVTAKDTLQKATNSVCYHGNI